MKQSREAKYSIGNTVSNITTVHSAGGFCRYQGDTL